ncbi:DUF2231 domain-containing protein [Sphingosinicella sp. LHD-64]|uniref:DUF2231 domain-containing protein n=1 Tax=Sphingosinicella sp. LHD-64 TaxID=3072139 RepID=UPI00280E97DB|nr:DUF2231 domain-containing protein [Sphingosinicella sp. LHD-64]MDQ8756758.1 DUF2231 domain-containing protein [Sphingosinicella sp. LHD-64]
MVLIRALLVAFAAMSVLFGLAGTGEAHKNHNKVEAAQNASTASQATPPAAMADHGGMEMAEALPGTMPERAVAWLGKMHPAAVHFPIALFPAAFVLLGFARRREGVAAVARGLIVFAGIAAAGAALMGWISAGFTIGDTDPVQAWHRWIGTAIAAAGLIAALWAWRRRDTVSGGAMVTLTGAISLAIFIQGGLGGILTHGLEHMRF